MLHFRDLLHFRTPWGSGRLWDRSGKFMEGPCGIEEPDGQLLCHGEELFAWLGAAPAAKPAAATPPVAGRADGRCTNRIIR
ncbi:MAG: hypothetical protein WC247_06255 [Porticoccaceae bacterium]